MSLPFASLPTWMTLPLDPDGVTGSLLRRLAAGLASTGLAILGTGLLITGENHPLGVDVPPCSACWSPWPSPRCAARDYLLARHLLLRLWLVLGRRVALHWRGPSTTSP